MLAIVLVYRDRSRKDPTPISCARAALFNIRRFFPHVLCLFPYLSVASVWRRKKSLDVPQTSLFFGFICKGRTYFVFPPGRCQAGINQPETSKKIGKKKDIIGDEREGNAPAVDRSAGAIKRETPHRKSLTSVLVRKSLWDFKT